MKTRRLAGRILPWLLLGMLVACETRRQLGEKEEQPATGGGSGIGGGGSVVGGSVVGGSGTATNPPLFGNAGKTQVTAIAAGGSGYGTESATTNATSGGTLPAVQWTGGSANLGGTVSTTTKLTPSGGSLSASTASGGVSSTIGMSTTVTVGHGGTGATSLASGGVPSAVTNGSTSVVASGGATKASTAPLTGLGGTIASQPVNSAGRAGVGLQQCPQYRSDGNGDLVLLASEANNYRFSSNISLQSGTVKPKSKLTFDWSGVTHDILGRAVDPELDIGHVSVLLWKLTKAQLESNINDSSLSQRDLAAGASIFTKNAMTAGGFDDMEIVTGGPIRMDDLLTYFDSDKFDPAVHIYSVIVASGTSPGRGTRAIRTFTLDPTSSNTEVTIDSNSTHLTYSADLHTQARVLVPSASPHLAVDWSSMDGLRNALGQEFDIWSISRAMIASFAQTPTELESKFLDLEILATGLWQADVETGVSVALSSFRDAEGHLFAGIDTTQTWLLALECSRCMNPAPWYIMILESCAG